MTTSNKKSKGVETFTPLQAIINNCQDVWGKDLIGTLDSSEHLSKQTKGISWDIPSVNYICSKVPFIGVPFGRIVELFGNESSGKTTLCLHAVALSQRQGIPCAFIDAEHAVDLRYAIAIGVDAKNLIFVQPDYGEQAIDVIIELIKQGVKLVIVDSVAALTPLSEIEGTMEKTQPGTHARLMSKAMRLMRATVKKKGAVVIFINQIRMKIGVMFGNPEDTPGGKALKFFSDIRLEIRMSQAKSTSIKGANMALTGKKDKERLGSNAKIKCIKNKVSSPFLDTEVPLYYGRGFDKDMDLFNFAETLGLVKKGKGNFNVGSTIVKFSDLANYTGLVWELLEDYYNE